MGFVNWYNKTLRAYPKTTEIVTSFILTYTSDCICQYISKPDSQGYWESFSHKRAWNLSIFGAGLVTPMFHYWYKFLSVKWPTPSIPGIIVKSLVDRFTIGSLVVVGFFVSQHLMNGGNYPDLKLKLEKDLLNAIKMNVTVWTSALVLNFKYVPIEFQVLFLNTIGFFWMIYLSLSMNSKKHIKSD